MGKTPSFEIIAGTYEEYLVGYSFTSKSSELVQSFASHDHSASIRCIANCDHYLASGGADDRIIVYDLKARKEHCMLTQHNSTINALQFTKDHSHVLSGSNDGVLSIVRVGNWQLEKVWDKAHKGSAIYDIAIHPSGKLALSLGADQCLHTWNLVKGRQAYVINLKTKCKDAKSMEKILFAQDGTRFVLYGGRYTEIWSIETGGILKVVEHEHRVCSCVWIDEENIIVGYENGDIAVINVESGDKDTHKAHDSRVKSLAVFKKWITTASSNGEIKVWNKDLQLLAKVSTGCRITCMVLVPLLKDVKVEEEEVSVETVEEVKGLKKKGRVVVEIDESDDDGREKVKKKKKKRKLQ